MTLHAFCNFVNTLIAVIDLLENRAFFRAMADIRGSRQNVLAIAYRSFQK